METRERENIAKGQNRKLALLMCFRCAFRRREKRETTVARAVKAKLKGQREININKQR
jgi:hypothetical protein